MSKKFLKTIEGMLGKTYQYAGQIHYVADVKVDDVKEKVTIKTNLSSYDRTFDSMDEFLKYWEPVNSVPVVYDQQQQANQIAAFVESQQSSADKLIAILENNIAKVQADKEYIPQAQAINNNINSIININKMKLDVMKQMSKR